MSTKTIVNSLPGIGVCGDKRHFAQMMRRARHFYPDEYSFVPESFILPEERDLLEQYMS